MKPAISKKMKIIWSGFYALFLSTHIIQRWMIIIEKKCFFHPWF